MDLFLFYEKDSEKCKPAELVVKRISREFKWKLHSKFLDISEDANGTLAKRLGVENVPTVVINGKIVFSGDCPSEDELRKEIQKRIESAEGESMRTRRRYWSTSGLPETWGRDI